MNFAEQNFGPPMNLLVGPNFAKTKFAPPYRCCEGSPHASRSASVVRTEHVFNHRSTTFEMLALFSAVWRIDHRSSHHFHDPAIEILKQFVVKRFNARVLPERQRKSGNVQQPQLSAKRNLIERIRLASLC